MHRNVMRPLLYAVACLLPAAGAWANGAVYAMTNALGNNEVLVYQRAQNGTLSLGQTAPTGGGGSGLQLAGIDSLGSAGSIQLDPDHHLLFVVNTESLHENNGSGAYNTDCQQGTITSFRVAPDGKLTFADRVFSGGLFPSSLTVRKLKVDNEDRSSDEGKREHAELLYVLNAGGPQTAICHLTPATANVPNVTGLKVDRDGHLNPIDSTQAVDPGPASGSGENCSAESAAGFSALLGGVPAADFQCGLNPPSFARSPAQVRFTPDGDHLLVTVKGTNTILAFPVDHDGSVDAPVVTQAARTLPGFFGFTFDSKGHLLVSELFGSATAIPAGSMGAVSSFTVTRNGHLTAISSDVGDGGTAACWIALEPLIGRYVYVANNLSATISSYSVANNGRVTLLDGKAATASGPNDLAIATDGGRSYLYVVNAATGTVGAFKVNLGDGSLSPITGGLGLPTTSAQGLAAF